MLADVGYLGILNAIIGFSVLICLALFVCYLITVFPTHFKIIIKRAKEFSNFQKYSFCFSFVSIIMLSISLWAIGENKDLSKGFFIFQKILVFGSIVAMCFEDFYIWWKVLLILDAVLFNPLIQIHLEERDSWMIFDITTIVFLFVSWIVLFRKIKVKNGTPSTR